MSQNQEMTVIVTDTGKEAELVKPKTNKINRTNENVDWAAFTWNPVTGCRHECNFCYARAKAHTIELARYYPFKFEPTFRPHKLDAPKNTAVPRAVTSDPTLGRVFVCSMADLFGKWVPDDWIYQVFDACLAAPKWQYLFLTKWPERYHQIGDRLIEGAWYGASVIKQADVKRVERSMQKFDNNVVRWVSLEPMLEPIQFDDLSWCDLVVIGSQRSTVQPGGFVPAFAPHPDWVYSVIEQCKAAGVPYYMKENLNDGEIQYKLVKSQPRGLDVRQEQQAAFSF